MMIIVIIIIRRSKIALAFTTIQYILLIIFLVVGYLSRSSEDLYLANTTQWYGEFEFWRISINDTGSQGVCLFVCASLDVIVANVCKLICIVFNWLSLCISSKSGDIACRGGRKQSLKHFRAGKWQSVRGLWADIRWDLRFRFRVCT